MRRWMFFLFLAQLAATPFLFGMFASGDSPEPTRFSAPGAVSTRMPSLDPCDLLDGTALEFRGIVDRYGDIQRAADELGIETQASDC